MQTRILDTFKRTAGGRLAEDILRRCVHCGFCNATCPTYQLLGDENEGPRGRIYLIKQVLEGGIAGDPAGGRKTLQHLDRCLLCRNCETTCPSGVEYSKLLEIGRQLTAEHAGRTWRERHLRHTLRTYLPNSGLFGAVVKLGQTFKPLLPAQLANKVPPTPAPAEYWPKARHRRWMLVLEGCVQPALAPATNAATARVLDRLGISLVVTTQAGCCGAINQHLESPDTALAQMRRNIDAWWPYLQRKEGAVEAIITTASGCGLMVKEYAYHLRHDPAYAAKAERISSLCKDIAEVIATEEYQKLAPKQGKRVAWHPPCTLQHGQKIRGVVEDILTDLGYELVPVADPHLCCGSAGTYSLLQPELSQQLRTNKLASLTRHQPELIVTANIGCQVHLQAGSSVPVQHWIQLLDNPS